MKWACSKNISCECNTLNLTIYRKHRGVGPCQVSIYLSLLVFFKSRFTSQLFTYPPLNNALFVDIVLSRRLHKVTFWCGGLDLRCGGAFSGAGLGRGPINLFDLLLFPSSLFGYFLLAHLFSLLLSSRLQVVSHLAVHLRNHFVFAYLLESSRWITQCMTVPSGRFRHVW